MCSLHATYPAHIRCLPAVKIVGTNDSFRGFLVVAHLPGHNTTLLGRFVPQNINQQTVACDALGVNNQSAIGHSNPASADFQSQELVWQAPPHQDGVVDFRYNERRSTTRLKIVEQTGALCMHRCTNPPNYAHAHSTAFNTA